MLLKHHDKEFFNHFSRQCSGKIKPEIYYFHLNFFTFSRSIYFSPEVIFISTICFFLMLYYCLLSRMLQHKTKVFPFARTRKTLATIFHAQKNKNCVQFHPHACHCKLLFFFSNSTARRFYP